MKGKDIIVVGLQPWDIKIGSNCKNIAAEFAKHNRVLYVNRAIDRVAYLRGKDEQSIARKNAITGKEKDLNEIQPNLWVLNPKVVVESINWIGNKRIFDFFNHINNARLAKVIDEASRRLGFDKPVVFIDNDFIRYVELPALLKNKDGVIYYIRDYLNSQDYFRKHGKRLEPRLIKDATVVTANSAYLQEYAQHYRAKAWDIGQGCEIEEFSKVPKIASASDLAEIRRPIIGYVGALQALRLDIELIKEIARQKPEWNIVLVGPEDTEFLSSNLHHMLNVVFTGSKSPEELPIYINSFDVCINPQLINDL
ncbi:MAG: glycosyltransferase family 1 protein, partial [Chitinophagaceae bacterium]